MYSCRGIFRICSVALVCAVLLSCGGATEHAAPPTALPLVVAGEPYRAALGTPDNTTAARWKIVEGRLPDGLALNPQTGVVEGTTQHVGRFDLVVVVHEPPEQAARATVRVDVVEADAPHAAATASNPVAMTDLLSLLRSVPQGGWVQASLNRFSDVWVPDGLRPMDSNGLGTSVPSKIIAAWSGFAWDSNRGDLILYGGGHANYPGNEIYRWRGSTRLWERGSLPSDITRDASGNYVTLDGPDAAPVSAHTYDNNIFLPMVDRFLTFGGAAYNNGAAYRRATSNGQSRNTGPYLWDPAKADPNKVGGNTGSHVKRVDLHPEIVGGQMWHNRDFALNLAGNTQLPAWHLEGCTGYATENGKDVVYVGARLGLGTATQLFKYVINDVNNPKTDSWTQLGGYWDAPQGQTVCTFDPVQKLFVKLGNQTTPFTFWDVTATGGNSNYERRIGYTEPTGEWAARLASGQIDIRYCGLDFDPVRRQYTIWCGASDVWMLTPASVVSTSGWSLQRQAAPVSTSAPSVATGTGILGKWKYIPNLDAFMALQDSTAGNIWLYKPVGWRDPAGGEPTNQPPTVSLLSPSNGTQVVVGQVITLQATADDPDGSVVAVDFFDGSTRLAHVTAAPWRFEWSGAVVGTHTVRAVAYDNLAASQSSDPVTISIVQVPEGSVVLQDGLNGYAGTRDTHLTSNATAANWGTASALVDVYTYYAMMIRFAIFQRDGGWVPDNAVVQSAVLELYKSSYYSLTLSAYRLQCDWVELQASWNSCRSGVLWSSAGALGAGTDYVAQADGAGYAAWEPGWVAIDVTSGLLAMQAGSPNFGWRLRRTGGDDINTKRYFSREYAQVPGLRPRLTIHYTLP